MCSIEHNKKRKEAGETVLLGEIIRAKRRSLGMTQEELSKVTGITRPQIAKWELGDTHGIKKESLYALEQGLNCEIGELYKLSFPDMQISQSKQN